jgi:hypothetical protein
MKKPVIAVPYPTKAQLDYKQNGLILPKKREHLELLLKDVHNKGFLDVELCYRLRQKEAVKDVEREIVDKLKDDELVESPGRFRDVFESFMRRFEHSFA